MFDAQQPIGSLACDLRSRQRKVDRHPGRTGEVRTIHPHTAIEQIVASPAKQKIIAVATVEGVVAVKAIKGIVAKTCGQAVCQNVAS